MDVFECMRQYWNMGMILRGQMSVPTPRKELSEKTMTINNDYELWLFRDVDFKMNDPAEAR